MAGADDRKRTLALGELRGLLTAFGWANQKCNHSYSFMIEELPITDGIHASLTKHFCDSAVTVSAVEIPDWHELIEESLRKWLFQFGDVLKPNDVSALTDERCQGEMVALVMDQFIASLQPVEVWRVGIEPAGFYECAWDDFAIRGSSGFYLLHLGVSD